jgi:glycolate oxidase
MPPGSRLGGVSLPASFVAELEAALGDTHVVTEPEQLRVYECDGLTGHRAVPELVVLPGSTEDVQAVLRACHRERVPFVARGAGTGLSGGATPMVGGVVVSLARMNRILDVDLESQRIVVEPGVANLDVTRAVAAHTASSTASPRTT